MKFTGKTVWITGASNGIGKQLAIDLSKQQCRLLLSSRNEERLEATRQLCLEHTEHAAILPLDLVDSASLEEITKKALSLYEKIDLLIHCGGVSQRSLIKNTDLSVVRSIMEIDYLGTVALSKALLPHFIDHQSGHFVVVSSVMGMYSSPFRAAYAGAKHALHGFFDALRMEHEKDGIKVTLICPGFVRTDITRNAFQGDGSAYNRQDPKTEEGLPVDVFSKKMLKAIEKEKFEAYIGKKEALAVYIKRFSPKLLHKIIMRSKVR